MLKAFSMGLLPSGGFLQEFALPTFQCAGFLSYRFCTAAPGGGPPRARQSRAFRPRCARAGDAAEGGGAAGPLQLRTDPAFAHTEGNGFARHPFAALSPAACTRAQ